MLRYKYLIPALCACFLLTSSVAYADGIYVHTLDILNDVVTIVFGVAKIVGAAFVFMSFVYYRRFRQNSVETPISKVIWVLVFGIILFCFPLAAEHLSIYETMQEASQEVSPS